MRMFIWEGLGKERKQLKFPSPYPLCTVYQGNMYAVYPFNGKKNKNKKKVDLQYRVPGMHANGLLLHSLSHNRKGIPRFNTTSRCSLKDGRLRWGPQSLVGLFIGWFPAQIHPIV